MRIIIIHIASLKKELLTRDDLLSSQQAELEMCHAKIKERKVRCVDVHVQYIIMYIHVQCTNYILCTLLHTCILHVHVHVHAVGRSIELTTEISSTRTRIT